MPIDTPNQPNWLIRTKTNFKTAPLLPVHAEVYGAILLGQVACGYTLGVAGTAFASAQSQLGFSDTWLGLLGAGSLIGLAGSAVMGHLADRFGRKRLLRGNMYLFALLAALQFFFSSPLALFLLRVGLGLMMAIDYTVGNALLVEWLPKKHGAAKQTNLLIYWAVGFALSFAAGYLVPGWRWLLASSAIFGLVTAIFRTVVKLPASPAWLASHGKPKAAQRVVTKRMGPRWRLPKQWFSLKPARQSSWTVLFSKRYWRGTLVGSAFYATQAFSFFGISIFLPLLLAKMGIGNQFFSGLLYNGALLGGNFLGIAVFNRVGRRPFLLTTFGLATACLLAMGLLGTSQVTLLLALFVVFALALSASLLLDYAYTTELFDLKVRATGVGFVIMMSRVGAAGGTILLPLIVNRFGAAVTMLVCGLVLLAGTAVCAFFAPETNPQKQTN